MSNFCVESWNITTGGRSAFCDRKGHLIAEMDDTNSGFIIVEDLNDCWKGQPHIVHF